GADGPGPRPVPGRSRSRRPPPPTPAYPRQPPPGGGCSTWNISARADRPLTTPLRSLSSPLTVVPGGARREGAAHGGTGLVAGAPSGAGPSCFRPGTLVVSLNFRQPAQAGPARPLTPSSPLYAVPCR